MGVSLERFRAGASGCSLLVSKQLAVRTSHPRWCLVQPASSQPGSALLPTLLAAWVGQSEAGVGKEE